MTISKYYVGDIGTEIIVDTTVDLTAATVLSLKVLKPGTAEVTWSGTQYETTKIRYVIQSGDFNVAGVYSLQAYVEMPGWSGRGNVATFVVWDPFT
jgi:hypothetical protein